MVRDLVHNLCESLVENIDGVAGATSRKVVVATPVITLTGNSVTITCDTTGATIYYTLDGSTPTSGSTQYSAAFTLDSSCAIKAIAIKGGKSSAVAEESYVKPVTYLTQWKIVGNSEVHTLPYPDIPQGYTKCKYLEFDNAGYFETGIASKQGIGVRLRFSTTTENKWIFGVRNGNTGDSSAWKSTFMFGYLKSNSIRMGYGGSMSSIPSANYIDGNIHTVVLDSNVAKVDDVDIPINRGTIETSYNISIGCVITGGTKETVRFVGRIYDFVLYDEEQTLFNGIPCLDDNNTPCFYDTISGTTFYYPGSASINYEVETPPTEIWSCGEYSDVDNKYHVVVLPTGKQAVDIVLNEPLRKTNNTADTLEYPTETSGKALLTIRVEESGGELSPLDTPTTELVDVPQIEEADSYSCEISQGGKAVEWSSFITN